jgi:hypothetical protein
VLLAQSPSAFAQNLLNIRVTEGEGAIHQAGAKASRPIVVEVTDETGRPVDGVAVSFRMPEEGPGASFPQGMKTDIRITAPDGKAMAHDFVANRSAGSFQVRVTAVKGPVRAGVIVGQYVTDAPVRSSRAARSGGSRKWLILAAIGAAAGAGLAVGARSSSPAAGPGGPPPAAPAPPAIGRPSISVGGPQ